MHPAIESCSASLLGDMCSIVMCSSVVPRRSVTDTTFSPTQHFPICRQAFLAANLISPKVQDGISKLLVKSDMHKLTAKGRVAELELAERSFEEARGFLANAAGQRGLTAAEHDGLYGRFLVRVALHLAGKGKLGFEALPSLALPCAILFMRWLCCFVAFPSAFACFACLLCPVARHAC